MTVPKFEFRHGTEQVVATLATGEEILIHFTARMSAEGFGLVICGDFSKLLIEPQAANALHITTPKGLNAETAAVSEIVRLRKERTGS